MTSALIKGTIVGGIIAFLWSCVSWMVLPWHEKTMSGFANEEFVSWVLKENTKKDGLYVIPYCCGSNKKMTKEEKTRAWDKWQSKREEGPVVMAAIRPDGVKGGMTTSMIAALVSQFVGAAFISLLLINSSCSSYFGRVFFVASIGLIIGILGVLPSWIWWSFPANATLIDMADMVIAWFLAGLAMAPLTKIKHETVG